MSWCPEKSKIKLKMIYAGTKALVQQHVRCDAETGGTDFTEIEYEFMKGLCY